MTEWWAETTLHGHRIKEKTMHNIKPIANNLLSIRKSAGAIMNANHRLDPDDPVREVIDGQLVRICTTTTEIQRALCAPATVRGYKKDAMEHFDRLVQIYCASGEDPDVEQMAALATCAEAFAARIRGCIDIETIAGRIDQEQAAA
jgi:hypothetical protein